MATTMDAFVITRFLWRDGGALQRNDNSIKSHLSLLPLIRAPVQQAPVQALPPVSAHPIARKIGAPRDHRVQLVPRVALTRRLKAPEAKTATLKKMDVEHMLNVATPKEMLGKNF
ncbi:MAG: hypothetical protein FJX25_13450 [Alphaproteobacteria bacterium]|nr:hypothetical protein [Alphaproteobacteria bacterium]